MTYQYAIVEYAGTDEEHVTREFTTLPDAIKFANMINKCNASRVTPVDVMKILPDGSLTTEY